MENKEGTDSFVLSFLTVGNLQVQSVYSAYDD
jgi:hypothetical protein